MAQHREERRPQKGLPELTPQLGGLAEPAGGGFEVCSLDWEHPPMPRRAWGPVAGKHQGSGGCWQVSQRWAAGAIFSLLASECAIWSHI